MRKKKLLFVINYFYPDMASTGQLMTELCLKLQENFDITVIASQPTYAGEVIENKPLFDFDYLENIKIVRLRLPTVNKNSKISRIKYIFTYFIMALIASFKEKNIDIVYSISQPPILGGLIGTIVKVFKNCKHVYNIQDFNPEQAEAVSYSKNKWIIKIAKFIDNINCLLSNIIILVGNDMKETLNKRFNDKVPNHVVINNWINENEIVPLEKTNKEIQAFMQKYHLENKFIVMYSGNLGLFYDLQNIIRITKDFSEYPEIVFLFVGEGAVKEEMINFKEKNNLKNVIFLPYQEKSFIKYSLNVADVHFVVNQQGIKGVSVPSKIYGVMAVAKPILGVLEEGSEAHSIITASDCGVVINPGDYKGIIKTIKTLYCMDKEELIDKGRNGRLYLEKNLKKEQSISKYEEILISI